MKGALVVLAGIVCIGAPPFTLVTPWPMLAWPIAFLYLYAWGELA